MQRRTGIKRPRNMVDLTVHIHDVSPTPIGDNYAMRHDIDSDDVERVFPDLPRLGSLSLYSPGGALLRRSFLRDIDRVARQEEYHRTKRMPPAPHHAF